MFVLICILPFAQPQCLSYYEYLDSTTSLCLPCAHNCLTCLDSVTCAFCADEYYIDSNTNSCLKCPFGCQVCTSSTTCKTCNSGLYINADGGCVSCSVGIKSCSIAIVESCHDEYFLLGGICAGCLDNCKKCEDFVTCNICDIGYYVGPNFQSCEKCGANC